MKSTELTELVSKKLRARHRKLFEKLLAYGDVEQLRGFLNYEGVHPSVHLNDDRVWVEPNLMLWDVRRTGEGKTVRGALIDFIRKNFTPSGYGRYTDIRNHDLEAKA